jgi:hypothetical protein
MPLKIHLQSVVLIVGHCGGDRAAPMPQSHAHARQQFAHTKRLDRVVVSPQIQQMHFLAILLSGRYHDQRQVRAGAQFL